MTETELIQQYNAISDKHRGKSLLPDLTDHELFIFIIGKTYKYGRSLESSVTNAKTHMQNRKKAERLFSTKISDYF